MQFNEAQEIKRVDLTVKNRADISRGTENASNVGFEARFACHQRPFEERKRVPSSRDCVLSLCERFTVIL